MLEGLFQPMHLLVPIVLLVGVLRFSSALASWFKVKNRKNPDTRPIQIQPPPPVFLCLCISLTVTTRACIVAQSAAWGFEWSCVGTLIPIRNRVICSRRASPAWPEVNPCFFKRRRPIHRQPQPQERSL
jgi:hypothetical protein